MDTASTGSIKKGVCKMDKAKEIMKKLEELKAVVNSCDKSNYESHFYAIEESINRASYLVFNFDKSVKQLDEELTRRKQSEEKFKARLQEKKKKGK